MSGSRCEVCSVAFSISRIESGSSTPVAGSQSRSNAAAHSVGPVEEAWRRRRTSPPTLRHCLHAAEARTTAYAPRCWNVHVM